jgi:hypothetical protein
MIDQGRESSIIVVQYSEVAILLVIQVQHAHKPTISTNSISKTQPASFALIIGISFYYPLGPSRRLQLRLSSFHMIK